jgi:radical SAM protein with 4Fe4S-binding SPASM domain
MPTPLHRVEWELTRACNLRCAHCHSSPQVARDAELGPDEARRAARALAAAGARIVSLSGGEPTLRPDWINVVAELAGAWVTPVLVTNGQHLDAATARRAAAAGLAGAWVSVDGRPDTHDRIRRRPGAFQRALAATAALQDAGVPVGWLTTALRPNLGDLPWLAGRAAAIGLAAWQVWLGLPRFRSPLWLGPDAVPGLLGTLIGLRETFPGLVLGDNLGYGGPAEALRHHDAGVAWAEGPAPEAFTGCLAGHGLAGLRSDGSLVGCLALGDAPVGNLLTTPWEELSRRSEAAWEQRQGAISGGCAACARAAECHGGCHAMATLDGAGVDNPYCGFRARAAARTERPSLARTAASLVLAAALGSGACAPSRKPEAADAERGRATVVDAAVPDAAPLPDAAAPRPRVRPGQVPSCCYMHILVPGCRCGPGDLVDPPRPVPARQLANVKPLQ